MTKNEIQWTRQADGTYRSEALGVTLVKSAGWNIHFDAQGPADRPIRQADGSFRYHWSVAGTLALAKADAEDEAARRSA